MGTLLILKPYDTVAKTVLELGFSNNIIRSKVIGKDYPFLTRLDSNFFVDVTVHENAMPSEVAASLGTFSLNNADGNLDYLLDLEWGGREFSIYTGKGQDFADYSLLFSGTTLDIVANDTHLAISVRDKTEFLTKPLQENIYSGGGGTNGHRTSIGVPKPLCYGLNKNVSPVLLDEVLQIYQIHDGPVVGIDAVYDQGNPKTYIGDYPSYTSLAAANLSPETYASCNVEGVFRVGVAPAFNLTADVRGQFYSAVNFGETVKQILLSKVGLTVDSLDLPSFGVISSEIPGRVSGLYLSATDLSVSEWLTGVVGQMDCFWFYDSKGKLRIRRFKFTPSVKTLKSANVDVLTSLSRPKVPHTVLVGYDPNNTVIPASEFNLIVGDLELALTQEDYYIDTEADGSGGTYPVDIPIKAFLNGEDVGSLGLISFSSRQSWLDVSPDGTFDIKPVPADNVEGTIVATYQEFTSSVTVRVHKRKETPAKSLNLSVSKSVFDFDSYNRPAGSQTSVITATPTNLTGSLSWGAVDNLGNPVGLNVSGNAATLNAASIIASPLISYAMVAVGSGVDGVSNVVRIPVSRASTGFFSSLMSLLTLAGGKRDIFFNDNPPTDAVDEDLWFDTNDNNKLYRRYQGSWLEVSDPRIAQALSSAAGAQASADGKITTYSQEAAPVNNPPATKLVEGDLWFKPSTKALYRYTGGSWSTSAPVSDVTGYNVAAAILGQAPAATDSSIQSGATNDKVKDTRSTNETPAWYRTNYPFRSIVEFKDASAIAIPGGTAGHYGAVTTTVDYPDASGGVVKQRFVSGSGGEAGKTYTRISATNTTWGDWQRDYNGFIKPGFGMDIVESPQSGILATLEGFKTLLGTSSAFVGQGPFATISSIGYGNPLLTGFGDLAQRQSIRFGGPSGNSGGIYNEAGSSWVTDSQAITSLGTSAGFVGQAPAATDSSIQSGATNDKILDTRYKNDTPEWYRLNYPFRSIVEFKDTGTLDIPGGASGHYGAMTTTVDYLHASGGEVKQRFVFGSGGEAGKTYTRISATNTTWGDWQRDYNGFMKPGFGMDIVESPQSGTLATLEAFKTLLGTSSAFVGQGPFATISSIGYGNPLLTGFGDLAQRQSIRFGGPSGNSGGIYNEAGSSWITDSDAITNIGTAAGFVGQGPGATASGPDVLNNLTEGGIGYVPSPGGGIYNSPNINQPGAIKITLPVTSGDSMVRFTVDVYNYAGGESSTYIVGGYSSGSGTWYNTSAQLIGPHQRSVPVFFGKSGGKDCIWIGLPTTIWNHPQVKIRDVTIGYYSSTATLWSKGWEISLDTTAATNVTSYHASPRAGDTVFGEGLFESSGILATLGNFKTILGTAAGFSGQTAAATAPDSSVFNSYVAPGMNLISGSDQRERHLLVERWNPDNAVLGLGTPTLILPGTLGWTKDNYVLDGSTRSVSVITLNKTNGVRDFIEYGIDRGDGQELRIPIQGGQKVIGSAFFVTHNCVASVLVCFFDVNGGFISADVATQSAPYGTSSNRLSLFQRIHSTMVAPSNAATVGLILRKQNGIDDTTSYMWMAAPMLEIASANQTTPSPYQAGPPSTARQVGYLGELNADYTATHTAASIAGQAPAATDNTIQSGATNDRIPDVRSTNQPPSWYRINYPRRTIKEFKQGNTMGFPTVEYGTLTTVVGYEDFSGGSIHQYFTSDLSNPTSTSRSWTRYSTNENTWSTWQKDYDGYQKPVFGEDLQEVEGTLASLANFKTGLGTSAGFSGQGVLATRSYVRVGYEITLANGTTIATEAMMVTANGVSAGFVGQGVWATLNDPNATPGKLAGVETGADVTSVADGPRELTAAYDYQGAPKNLPQDFIYRLFKSGTAITGASWTYLVQSGTVNSISNANGPQAMANGVFRLSSLTGSSAVILITATLNGVARHVLVSITKKQDPAPTSGATGGGTSATGNIVNSTNSTSYPANGSTSAMTVTTGSTGKITFSGFGSFSISASGSLGGQSGVYAKWQCRVPGGTWADATAEFASSQDAVQRGREPGTPVTIDDEPDQQGAIEFNGQKTGLTAMTQYEVRLAVRVMSPQGTIYFDVQYTAQGG